MKFELMNLHLYSISSEEKPTYFQLKSKISSLIRSQGVPRWIVKMWIVKFVSVYAETLSSELQKVSKGNFAVLRSSELMQLNTLDVHNTHTAACVEARTRITNEPFNITITNTISARESIVKFPRASYAHLPIQDT